MRKPIIAIAGVVGASVLGLLLVQYAMPQQAPPTKTTSSQPSVASLAEHNDQPKISWSTSTIAATPFPGETITKTVSFTSDTPLQNVALKATPEIGPYVTIQPTGFANVPANKAQQIQLSLSVPSSTPLGKTYEGTVHLRTSDGANNQSGGSENKNEKDNESPPKPLEITLTVTAHSFVSSNLGVKMNYPATWVVQQQGSSVVIGTTNLDSQAAINDNTLQTTGLFQINLLGPTPGSASIGPANPHALDLDQWINAYFGYGFADTPIPPSHLVINGHTAIQISTIELGGRRAHIYIARGSDVVEVNYGQFAPSFEAIYEAMLHSITLGP